MPYYTFVLAAIQHAHPKTILFKCCNPSSGTCISIYVRCGDIKPIHRYDVPLWRCGTAGMEHSQQPKAITFTVAYFFLPIAQ